VKAFAYHSHLWTITMERTHVQNYGSGAQLAHQRAVHLPVKQVSTISSTRREDAAHAGVHGLRPDAVQRGLGAGHQDVRSHREPPRRALYLRRAAVKEGCVSGHASQRDRPHEERQDARALHFVEPQDDDRQPRVPVTRGGGVCDGGVCRES